MRLELTGFLHQSLRGGLLLCIGFASLSLTACGGRSTPSSEALLLRKVTATAGIDTERIDPSRIKLLAADYFQTLALASTLEPLPVLDGQISRAILAEQSIHSSLGQESAESLTLNLHRLADARTKRHRQDIALASAEAYRALISDATFEQQIPINVRMLGYAGLRYQAGLEAQTARWDDMHQATVIARAQWTKLLPDIAQATLRARGDAVMASMERAVARKDAKAANEIVQTQMVLAKALESYFLSHPVESLG